jgi:hypothetical protein
VSAQREIERLENLIEREDFDEEERREIIREIRDLERDDDERERWEREGNDRGWR